MNAGAQAIEQPGGVDSFVRHSPSLVISGENGFFLLRWSDVAGILQRCVGGAITMKKTILLTFVFAAASFPALAKHHIHHRDRASSAHSRISCETVRAYVAQVGLAQAKAMAQAAGMTDSEEREAAQCLEKKI
jgi:hypothetical protein